MSRSRISASPITALITVTSATAQTAAATGAIRAVPARMA